MKEIIVSIGGKTYKLQESVGSAGRVLRNAMRDIHAEEKRNVRNPEVHKLLQKAIAYLQECEEQVMELFHNQSMESSDDE